MLYSLEQGRVEQDIIRQCIAQRRPLPDKIANAPEVWLGLELYISAFFELTTCRSIGFGEGPIPWTAVSHWCDIHNLSGEQREDMHYHISRLDSVYLDHRAKKLAKPAVNNGPQAVRPKDARNR